MQAINFPGLYVQGRNILGRLGEIISVPGDNVLIIGGKTALRVSRKPLEESLSKIGVMALFYEFSGECSQSKIDECVMRGKQQGINLVIGVGGGKALDTAKVTADILKVPCIVIPTVASTDAPCSGRAGIYTDDGIFVGTRVLTRSPEMVIVDLDVIVEAPVRLFVAGMGDALSTWIEAEACRKKGIENLRGGFPTSSALKFAELCFEIVMNFGREAKLAVENNLVTPAVEKVVEANILLSGVGFESCGLSVAHALQGGLTVLKEVKDIYHGEKVAFGVIVQMILEGYTEDEVSEIIRFYCDVGLPVALEDLGLDGVEKERIMEAMVATCKPSSTVFNLSVPVTPESLYDAVMMADILGRKAKKLYTGKA